MLPILSNPQQKWVLPQVHVHHQALGSEAVLPTQPTQPGKRASAVLSTKSVDFTAHGNESASRHTRENSLQASSTPGKNMEDFLPLLPHHRESIFWKVAWLLLYSRQPL